MLSTLVTAALAFNLGGGGRGATRREALAAASGFAAAASSAMPAAAIPKLLDLSDSASKPATGVQMLLQAFDGKLPSEGLVPWLEAHLADTFTIEFKAAGVTLKRQDYIAASDDLLKSFPDLAFTRKGPMAYDGSPFLVSWTAEVKGTHSGAPFSPLPGVPAVKAQSPPVACANDPEKVTATVRGALIEKMVVEPIPGGNGFSGPVGFYLQAGGDPAKLPKA